MDNQWCLIISGEEIDGEDEEEEDGEDGEEDGEGKLWHTSHQWHNVLISQFVILLQKKRMTMMRNRRNFIFCKCAVTEEILKKIFEKTTKKNTSKNLKILL